MAKLKTKKGPIETLATEVESGVWQFSTDNYDWRHTDRMGLNLLMAHKGEGAWQGCLYAKTLNEAIMFTHGFDCGVVAERRTNAKAKAEN